MIAALLSLTIVFGLCGSELTAQTVKAQELEETQDSIEEERQEQEEISEDNSSTDIMNDGTIKEKRENANEVMKENSVDKEQEIKNQEPDEEVSPKEAKKETQKKISQNELETKSLEKADVEHSLYVRKLLNDSYEHAFGEEKVFAEGDTVKMEVEAETEGGELSYEWYKVENDSFSLTGAVELNEVSPVCTIKKSGEAKEYYICKVSNGKETENVEFEITKNIWNITQYIDGKADTVWGEYAFGSKVKLEVRAEAYIKDCQISYQWEKKYDEINSANSSVYEVILDDPDDDYVEYSCTVELKKGEEVVQSEKYRFELYVEKTLNVESSVYANGKEYFDTSVEVYEGTEVVLKASATSSHNSKGIKYAWYLYNLGEPVKMDGFTSDECKLVKDSSETQEIYCVISDGATTVKEEFYIDRKSRIQGSTWIDGEQTSFKDLSQPGCELKVEISSRPSGASYTYHWEKNVDGNGFDAVNGVSGNICKVTELGNENSIYRCTVKDGKDEKKFRFRLYNASLMVRCFVNQEEIDCGWNNEEGYEIPEGERVILSVQAESSYSSRISYKWSKEVETGREVLSETSSSYQFCKGKEWIEDYYCEISDGFQVKMVHFSIEEGSPDAIKGTALIDGGNSTPGGLYDASVKAVCGQTYYLELELPEPESGSYKYTWGTYDEHDGITRKISTASDCKVQAGTDDTEYYACRVKDGKDERLFLFNLEADSLELTPNINGKSGKEIYLEHGDKVILSVDAQSSYQPDHIAYTWQLGRKTGVKGNANGNQYSVMKYGEYEQEYICKISDGYTTRWITFYLYSDSLEEPISTIDGMNVNEIHSAAGTKHTIAVNTKSKAGNDEIVYWWTRIDKNGRETYLAENDYKNKITFLKRDDTETYSCEISDGRARKIVYFNFLPEDLSCSHDFSNVVTKATLYKDGSIVSRCKKCSKVQSTTVIPYPKTIRLSSETFTYNGKAQRPTVIVIGSDGRTIAASNYTVSYSAGSTAAGTYAATITFTGNYTGSVEKTYTIKNPSNPANTVPSAGTVLKAPGTKVSYKVVQAGKTVEYKSVPNKKVKSASVPSTVKINNVTYKVTGIASSAFKNCKKLKKVTIGANVTSIGKQAFYGCKSLKTVTVKSKSIKKVGSKAFKGIHKKASIKVPKAKLKAYKKLFKKGNVAKSVKIKK